MMVEVRDPLPAGSRHVQIFYPVVEVHRDAVPKKRRVPFNNVGGRRIAKLPVEIGSLDQFRLETGCLLAIFRDWKACHLDCRRNTRRVADWRFIESLEYK